MNDKYIIDRNMRYEIVTEIPAHYHVWNIGAHLPPAGYIPLKHIAPNQPFLAIRCENEADRTAIMQAASFGAIDIESAEKILAERDNNNNPSELEQLSYQRAEKALPALKKLAWENCK